jgi:RhtB (resistance to homoserine/threonine) family protein
VPPDSVAPSWARSGSCDHGSVHLGPFLAVAAIVVITPGVDMALVTRNALMYGRRAAVMTALGINLGILFWVVAAALGLAAIVATSANAFAAIKLAGAVYLIYLGVQALRSTRSDRQTSGPNVRTEPSGRLALRQGLVSNLLNPKIAIFFTSLLPQFVGADGSAGDLLLLGLLFNAMGICWLLCYAIAAARGRNFLVRPRVKRMLDRISGVVLIGLGTRLVLERR